MCKDCAEKDKLIHALNELVRTQRNNICELVEAFDAAKPYLPEVAHKYVNNLTLQARQLAGMIL